MVSPIKLYKLWLVNLQDSLSSLVINEVFIIFVLLFTLNNLCTYNHHSNDKKKMPSRVEDKYTDQYSELIINLIHKNELITHL